MNRRAVLAVAALTPVLVLGLAPTAAYAGPPAPTCSDYEDKLSNSGKDCSYEDE